MKFELTILGCGSATPTLRYSPTSQLLEHEGHHYLIDCGEGTQLQLRRYKIKFQRINHIFISHLHGDHYFGLPGLLSTLHLLGRTNPLTIYAHPDLQDVIMQQLHVSQSYLRFPLHWVALDYDGLNPLLSNDLMEVSSFPLSHRIPTCGFVFREKPKPRNIIAASIEKYKIPVARIRQIKAGSDYTLEDGALIPNAEITTDPPPSRAYAYCSDTAAIESTAVFAKDVDLMYHESTFLQKDKKRAKETYHSTARQAAEVAVNAGAKKLLLGHFSARYRGVTSFLKEAKDVHPRVELAVEGKAYPIGPV